MKKLHRFYLNESILDDLMNDPDYVGNAQSASNRIAQDVVTSSTDNDDYQHIFEFQLKRLPKNKQSDWYMTRLRDFQNDLVEVLGIDRHIRDFNHKIVFDLHRWRNDGVPKVEVEEDDLYFIIYEDEDVRARLASKENDIRIKIGMNVALDTPFQLRKVLMFLYRTFESITKMNFGTQANPSVIQYVSRQETTYRCTITANDMTYWKSMPKTFDRSIKNMFCAIHPEIKPRFVQKMLDEWRDAQIESGKFAGDVRAIELLKNLGLYQGNEEVKFNESDKTVSVKIRSSRKWEPTKLDKLIDFINNYEYAITIKGIDKLHIGFNYVDNQIDDVYRLLDIIEDCKNIFVQIQNSMQLMNKYDGKTIDLVAIFPGYKVSGTVINCDPKTVVKNLKDYDLYDYTVKVRTIRDVYNSTAREYRKEIHIETYHPKAFKLKNSKR